MRLTRQDLGIPETHTVWWHDHRVLVVDDTPSGDRVLVVYYHESQPDLNDPMWDQVFAHFRTAGMGFICEQGVIQVEDDLHYPYAIFC